MTAIIDNKAILIKWVLVFLIPVSLFLFPSSEVFTADLRLFFVISIFVILLVAFELMPLLIPSIVLQTLYFLSGLAPMNIAFGSWSSTTVWMILGALILANVLEECGLLGRIALFCIRKCGGTFTGTLYGIFIAGVVISFITFSQAFIIMMTLTYGICLAMKLERSDASALVCFVGMLGGVTTCTFMYNPGYLALGEAGIRALRPEFAVTWYDSLMYNGPVIMLVFLLIWGLTKLFKTNTITFEGGKEYFEREAEKLGSMSFKEKKALVILVLLMVYLFTGPLHKLPAAYGFMTFPYLMFLPGISVASANCTQKTNFSIIFFIASCLSIGILGSSLGVGDLISHIVSPILADTNSLVALLVMITFGVVANMFLTPYAMMAALSMPFAKIGIDLGMEPLTTVMALVLSTDMILFPHEVAACLLMYSFGLISMKRFIQFSIIKIIALYIFFIFVLYPYWKFMDFI